MANNSRFGRRAFLRGAGGVVVALPFLSSLARPARAQGTSVFPKRFIVFFSPNGTVRKHWRPFGGERTFQLGSILEPLEPHRDQLLILKGINMTTAKNGPGDGHQTGMGHMLTARELLTGDLFEGGGGGFVGWAGGISADQEIANHIGQTTKFKSLEFGVQVHGSNVWSRMCYLGANQPLPPENDPRAMFDRVFKDVDADPAALARIRTRRKSVLDMVRQEYKALLPTVDRFDRQKLDQHLTAIREVEKRLDIETTGVTDYCTVPSLPPDIAAPEPSIFMEPERFGDAGRAQMDILVSSLACDLTRVASIQWSQSVSQHVFRNLGITSGHHDLSHEPDDAEDAQDKLVQINRWYAQQFAYLLDKLSSVQEGDGTLLDNTVVLWCNELGKGNSHTRDDVPYVLAGSAGGYLDTGRFLEFPLTNHNDLLLTLIQAMGVPANQFGDPIYSNGPLTRLLA